MSTKCQKCGRDIVWATTEAGKSIPLDPPEKRFVRDSRGEHLDGLHVRVVDTYVTHFATCPYADEFRKG